jgi:hypothetical protein
VATGPIKDARTRTLRRRLLVAISLTLTALALALATALAVGTNEHHSPPWIDWATYSDALGRLLNGGHIYDSHQMTGPYTLPDITTTGYVYAPASLPLFAPFGSQPIGLAAWLTLNVAILVSGIYAILRRELGNDGILFLGIAILPVVLWIGFLNGLTAGNVTIGLSGVLAWAWAAGRGRTSAAAVAVIAVAKMFPGVLVCWTTPSRLVRSVFTAGLIAGTWILITLPLVGLNSWADFIRAMGNGQPTCGWGTSVPCLLEPALGVSIAKLASIMLAGALGLGAVFVRYDLLAFTMIALAWIVPLPDVIDYSLLPLAVVGVVVFAIAVRRVRSREFGMAGVTLARLMSKAGRRG